MGNSLGTRVVSKRAADCKVTLGLADWALIRPASCILLLAMLRSQSHIWISANG